MHNPPTNAWTGTTTLDAIAHLQLSIETLARRLAGQADHRAIPSGWLLDALDAAWDAAQLSHEADDIAAAEEDLLHAEGCTCPA